MGSILAFWRRKVRDLSELSLWKVLQARGTRKIADQQPEKLEVAVERCLGCDRMATCEEMIAAGRDAEIEAFCPNVMYFRHLEAMKRHAPKRNLVGPDA